jgi:TRAP-type C4-dicarboxylate transport system permease large subunit
MDDACRQALLYRDLTWGRFRQAMIDAGIATGVVMLVIMGSAVVGWLLTFDQVPTRFAEWVTATIQNKYLVILALNVLMLIVGMPLDLPPAILLLGPIFVPLAASIGLDPVQLGLIMVINLGIGLYTPPIGPRFSSRHPSPGARLPIPHESCGRSSS